MPARAMWCSASAIAANAPARAIARPRRDRDLATRRRHGFNGHGGATRSTTAPASRVRRRWRRQRRRLRRRDARSRHPGARRSAPSAACAAARRRHGASTDRRARRLLSRKPQYRRVGSIAAARRLHRTSASARRLSTSTGIGAVSVGRRRQRRRLRRPDRRCLAAPTATAAMPAQLTWCSARPAASRATSTCRRSTAPTASAQRRAARRPCAAVAVASAGDVNGDGFDDLIVGAPRSRPGGSYCRREPTWCSARPRASPPTLDLVDASTAADGFRLSGDAAGDRSPAARSPRPATSTATASTT